MTDLPLLADLPKCRWRGKALPSGRLACSSPKLHAPRGVTPETCARPCYCADHEPVARKARPAVVASGPPGLTAAVRYCPTRAAWEWKVLDNGRVVETDDEATEADAVREAEAARKARADQPRPAAGLKWAAGTVGTPPTVRIRTRRPDPAATPAWDGPVRPPGRRHLLYHLLPASGNGVWQRNLDQLKWRMPLFDGRKVIAIGVGTQTDHVTHRGTLHLDPPDMVREYLDGHGCEFLEFENDPTLREVASWEPLWGRLADLSPTADVAFYGHAKGVTRPVNPGTTVHEWTRVMYSACLDYWPEVADLLTRCPLAGPFLKAGRGFVGSASSWHYSGTFFWARLSEAIPKYREIDRAWFGNEAWPGLHWPASAAGCIVHPGRVPSLDLFSFPYFRDRALPDFRRWALTARRTPCST